MIAFSPCPHGGAANGKGWRRKQKREEDDNGPRAIIDDFHMAYGFWSDCFFTVTEKINASGLQCERVNF